MKEVRYFLGRQKKRLIELFRLAGRNYFLSRLPNKSMERLRELRGAYANFDCVIVGNGPSLNEMDLNLLKGQYCFFFNEQSYVEQKN